MAEPRKTAVRLGTSFDCGDGLTFGYKRELARSPFSAWTRGPMMCSCGELDPSYVCVTHRDTRHDPGYFLPALDVLGFDPYEPEVQSPAEYEVLDG